MSLRTRLVISFTVLLLIVIGAVGLVASRSIRDILVGQIDGTLTGFVDRGGSESQEPPSDEVEQAPGNGSTLLSPFAEVLVADDGSIVLAEPSGFIDDPDPLPVVEDLPADSGLVYLDSVDGSLEYRAYVQHFPNGLTLIRAAPLSDVKTATEALIRTLLLAGSGVLLLGAAATWWTVRSAMEPVDEMVDAAEAIAAGDLTRRVGEVDPDTELGRLGVSLNEMLAHLEHALETEKEGRERLRQFAADASHELRTPLTAIAGYAELQRRGGLEARDAEDRAWARIESEARRMGRLVEDLLTLARLGQSQPLHIVEMDLSQALRDAAADHAVIDPDRPIKLSVPDELVVEADQERLTQVITSLLSNVRVHTPPGTEVSIDLLDKGDSVVLVVADNGPGIPHDALEHVFDRFYRADPSRSRSSGGTGLGLAIVQVIVEAHGGTATASSVEEVGTRITIHLPKIADPSSQPM